MSLDILYFKRNNFVHRDLKLENIMLDSKDGLEIKLVDFGFSEKINRDELISKAGTPGFIPPEIFKNQPYTEEGDIFSLGVIFYSVTISNAYKKKTLRLSPGIHRLKQKIIIKLSKPIKLARLILTNKSGMKCPQNVEISYKGCANLNQKIG